MKKYDILVIGGDAAGMSAASQARRINKNLSIAVLEKGQHVSYAACGMPYYIADEIKDSKSLVAIDIHDYITKKNIEIQINTEVLSLNFSEKRVQADSSDGDVTFSYDTLVIATGARPLIPPIPGIDGPNIFYLRNLAHGIAIKSYIIDNKPRKGIIIGGGYIGLEMAEAMNKLSIETTIIEKFESVAMTMSPDVRAIITRTLLDNKITIRTSESIRDIVTRKKGLSVRTDKGTHEADFILVSTGIVPNTDFLKNSGIRMNEGGAIIVDQKSRTNIPGVFSAGDCATVRSLITGNDIYVPLGTTANKQGRVAGLQAAGIKDERFKGSIGSQLVKIFDLEVGKTGMNAADAAKAGIESESSSVLLNSKAGYYPSTREIFVSLTINRATRELIGGEVVGTDGAALRSNIIATAIASKMKIEDLAYLDLGYAPPFSPVWDPVNAAAQKLVKRTAGRSREHD